MKKEKERKQIAASGFLGILVGVILLGISIAGFLIITKAQSREAGRYLQEVTAQYSNTVVKQVDGDFQTLEALVTFVGQDEVFDKDEVLRRLEVENNKNKFIRMGFVDTDGIADIVELGGNHYKGLDISGEDFVRKALEGQNAVSDTRKDRLSEHDINCYAVPVYHKGKIIGALTAVDLAESFSKILDEPMFGDAGYVYIVNGSGDILVRSGHSVVPEDTENIFDTGILRKPEDALQTMEKSETWFGEAADSQNIYWTTLMPVGINDWYMFTLVPKNALNGNFLHLMGMFLIVLVLMVALFSVLFFYIRHITRTGREEVERLAYYDTLTGAPNRNRYVEAAEEYLLQDHSYALILFNIDNFKYINELFGYRRGDGLLKHMAEVIRKNLREGELYYRENADRFGCMIHETDTEEIRRRAGQMQMEICSYDLEKNQEYNIICNCGVNIVEFYSREIHLDVLLDRTRMALTSVKESHRNTISFYNDELHRRATRRNEIEARMRQALRDHEFKVNLQPKYRLRDGVLQSAEALVRWVPEDGTMIYPDEFIPVFEQNGFITELDMYMLEEVCRILKRWREKGFPVVPVAVNQSRIFFYDGDFLEKIKGTISRYEIPPSLIILEVTEGVSMENQEHVKDVIEKLHRFGVSVSMDDFGSGYSSLNVLKELQIDELKLDRGFMEGGEDASRREAIMKNIVHLAGDLSIHTVTEGVETEEQAEFLRSISCEVGQGYYFSRPLPVEEFEKKAGFV